MKFALVFLLCCVAFVAAAPQFITYPGYVGTVGVPPLARTVVAGPTVVNAAPYARWGGLYGAHWW